MKTAHAGMEITDAEFNALAGDLKASLDTFKVPAQEQKDLLAAVETTRKDIVESMDDADPVKPPVSQSGY